MSRILQIVILILLSIFINKVSAQNIKDIVLTPEQMQEDVRLYYKTLLETHPNPYQVLNARKLDKEIHKILNSLNKPMSLHDFWLRIGRMNCYFDGHTRINFLPDLEAYLSKGYLDNQYLLTIKDNRIFFNPQCSIIDNALKGCEIVSINHIPAHKLLKNTKLYTSFEPIYQEKILPLLIIPISVNQLKNDTLFHIEYRNSITQKNTFTDIAYNYLNLSYKENTTSTSVRTEVCSLRHYPEEKIAIIELNDFGSSSDMPMTEYCAKIKTYMDSVIHSDVQHLFLDITANGGGNSARGFKVLDYLQTEKDRYLLETTGIKISPLYIEQRELGRKLKNFQEADSIIKSRYDTVYKFGDVFYGNSFWEKDSVEETYKNKVYLLQSRNTYSAAMDMAVLFSYYHFGKVIGEETGGLTSCYIDILSIELPNSKISACYSFKHVISVGSKQDGRGVLPDINYKIENPFQSFSLKQLQDILLLAK